MFKMPPLYLKDWTPCPIPSFPRVTGGLLVGRSELVVQLPPTTATTSTTATSATTASATLC